MSYVIKTDDAMFDSDIHKTNVTLVDFYADWCQPCQQMAPILEDVARDGFGDVGVLKVDVDQNKFLSERYNIRNIPTMLLFVNGMEIARRTGTQGKGFLADWMRKEGL